MSNISGTGSLTELEALHCGELVGREPPAKILIFNDLSTLQQQQIDEVEAVMRPFYSALKLRGGETLDYFEMETNLSQADLCWAIPWAGVRLIRQYEALERHFERAKSEWFFRILDGSLNVIGRPNGVGDPRVIEQYFWAYSGLFSVDGGIYAAPSNLDEEILRRRVKEKLLLAQPTIWFDLLMEVKEVCELWPENGAVSDSTAPIEQNRRQLSPKTEQRLRDAHAVLQRAIRRRRPGGQPSVNQMARELELDATVKAIGFSYETIRKMLMGTYAPLNSLGLDPLVDSGTRT